MRKPLTHLSHYYYSLEIFLPSKKIAKIIYEHGPRIASVSIPFITLYEPIEKNLSVGSDLIKAYSSIKEIRNSDDLNFLTIKKPLLIVIVSVVSIAGTIFMLPGSSMIIDFHDVLISIYTVNEAYKNKNYVKIAKETLYLAKIIGSFSPHIKISLLSIKVVVSASSSLQGFVDGKWLEGSADFAMTVIKGYKASKELKKSFSTCEDEILAQQFALPSEECDNIKNGSCNKLEI